MGTSEGAAGVGSATCNSGAGMGSRGIAVEIVATTGGDTEALTSVARGTAFAVGGFTEGAVG